MQTSDEPTGNETAQKHAQQASLSAGELLQAERLRQDLSEKEVADDLHITMHYVRAIEANHFDKLPGAVFAKGYIKSYGLLLGLDPSAALAAYDAFESEQIDAAKEKTRIQVRKRKDRNRPWVIMSVLCFIALFALLWFFNSTSTSSEEVAPPVSTNTSSGSAIGASESAASSEPIVSTLIEPQIEPQAGRTEDAAASLSDTNPLDSDISPTSGTDLTPNPAEIFEAVEAVIEQDIVQLAVPQQSHGLAAAATVSEQEFVQEPPSDPATVMSALDAKQTIQVEAVGDDLLKISFTGESWIEVSDGTQAQIYRDLREAGDVLEIKGTAPFNVLLGDAPFAELVFNGELVDVSEDIRIDNSARLIVGR